MTPLLWMLSWVPVVLPAVDELPTPINVTLTSLNFTYILKWEAGPDTPDGVHYKVTYLPYRALLWDPVSGCEHVQKPLVCNLTAVFSNPMTAYLTRVTAHLGERASPPGNSQYGQHGFKPVSQLSLPLLSVTPSGRDLRVELQPSVERFKDAYKRLRYELQLRSSKDKPQVRRACRFTCVCVTVTDESELALRAEQRGGPVAAGTGETKTNQEVRFEFTSIKDRVQHETPET